MMGPTTGRTEYMTLQQLRYFQVLAKIEHYTKASQDLCITQPSLSYAMSELEKELDVQLFDRHGKKITLSAQGRTFLKYVDGSLALLDDGIKAVRLSGPVHGRVTLGYISSLSSNFLPEVLTSFYKDPSNEKITFNFVQNLNNALLDGLKQGDIDLAFCPDPSKDVASAPVLRQDLFLVLPRNHRLARRDEIDIHEVKNEPFILTNRKSGLRRMIGSIFREMKIRPKVAFEAEDCNVAITFVSLQYGLSIIPATSNLGNPEVLGIRLKNPEFSRTVYMAWTPSRNLSPVVRRVRDFIADRYSTSCPDRVSEPAIAYPGVS
ncbi:MAG: LysR family transcriptional regulator [Treponema sp.]|nr:LysR family transcriptional regulator [Treponema sp.]